MNLLANHFDVQQGMYFSLRITTGFGESFLSDIIEDEYWNYTVITSEKCFQEMVDANELLFNKQKRKSCFYLTNGNDVQERFSKYLKDVNYVDAFTESFMLYNGSREVMVVNKNSIFLVDEATRADDFIDVFVQAYGGERTDTQPYGGLSENYIHALKRALISNGQFYNFVLYEEGVPAAVASLCFKDGNGGIYNVGTVPSFRGRGLGSDITNACIKKWDYLGGKCLFLQTETDSTVERLYSKLGFETKFHGTAYSKG